jgi:toxin HigB-1
MIKSYRNRKTERFDQGERIPQFESFKKVAYRKLDMIRAAQNLNDLKIPPNNRLEALKGSRSGQFSIRINDQFRICFQWKGSEAYNVEIVDYHGEH